MGEAETLLKIGLPGILPDNRIIAGQCRYSDPLANWTRDATYLRGVVGGLDRAGVAVLRTMVGKSELKRVSLIVAVYGGSRTWEDVLLELLAIQESAADRVQFRVIARRGGLDRPANLIWIQGANDDHGHAITGNVGNLLASSDWDPTDAVMGFRLEPALADALRKWFDGLFVRSSPLTPVTAAAPQLRPPEGDEEGERLWREYLDVLDRREQENTAEPVIDAKTGEVGSAAEPTPSEAMNFPQPDPVLLEIQTVLGKGSVVALDDADRAPPLSAPVKAELFGEHAETRRGAARRQQRFHVSLFDEPVARRLGVRRGAMTARLGACSFMLRDGVRWVPNAAEDLLRVEFEAVEREAAAALQDAIGGRPAADFIEASLQRIAKDCATLAKEIAPGRKPPTDLVERVKADLTDRLRKNLEKGMTPGISRSRFQIIASESDREGPWDLVQTFLASAARLPRDVASKPRGTSLLKAKPEELLAAFDVFNDPLVAKYLDQRRVEYQARRELALIEEIEENPTATPKQRAYALYRLVKGEGDEAALAELPNEKAPGNHSQTKLAT